MNYSEFKQLLFSYQDVKYASFSKKIYNSNYQIIGVRTPILKQIIKDHYLDKDLDIEEFEYSKYVEMAITYFAIYLKRERKIEKQLTFLRKNISKAQSWAVTDVIPQYMSKAKFDDYYDFFLECYQSKETYKRRFAYVYGLKFDKQKEILKILNHINLNEEYMVMMAEAWLLSEMAINFEDEVYNFLSKVDDETLKLKTISKICDSFRYSLQSKSRFKQLR